VILAPYFSGFKSTITCCLSPDNIVLLLTTPGFNIIGVLTSLFILIKNEEKDK
jgi:hypothetical protein